MALNCGAGKDSWKSCGQQDQTSQSEGKSTLNTHWRTVCYHPVCLTYMLKHHEKCQAGWVTSWNQDRWEKHQQPQICGWYHSNGKSKEELKSLLMRVKEESERAGLKLNITKPKIIASGPITSWQIEGEKVEVVTDFLFLGSKITADGDCSHEIRRWCFSAGKLWQT